MPYYMSSPQSLFMLCITDGHSIHQISLSILCVISRVGNFVCASGAQSVGMSPWNITQVGTGLDAMRLYDLNISRSWDYQNWQMPWHLPTLMPGAQTNRVEPWFWILMP